MKSFWTMAPEIPSHIGVVKVCLGISLLTVDKIGELNGVFNEEYGGVVSHHVEISFFGIKFKSKTSRISYYIGESLFSSYSGKPSKHWGSLSYLIEELSLGVPISRLINNGKSLLRKVMGDFKMAMGSSTNCMNYSFGNSLSIKLGKFINKMDIL
jgi:hypothetical protein